MNPFKRTGFDTLIAKGTSIQGSLTIGAGQTTIIDGDLSGPFIISADVNADGTLVIGGHAKIEGDVVVKNVTISGVLICDRLIVEGQLALKANGQIRAKEIRYRDIHIETGSIVLAQMNHLDHISAGEQI